MAGNFRPSQWGTATNLPTAEYQVVRYATGDSGHAVQVAEGGVPAQAVAPLVTGDGLMISRTGKLSGTPSLTMDRTYTRQDFAASPQGTGIVPSATLASVREGRVAVKLAARGYVDPAAMVKRQGKRGTEVVTNDLQFIP